MRDASCSFPRSVCVSLSPCHQCPTLEASLPLVATKGRADHRRSPKEMFVPAIRNHPSVEIPRTVSPLARAADVVESGSPLCHTAQSLDACLATGVRPCMQLSSWYPFLPFALPMFIKRGSYSSRFLHCTLLGLFIRFPASNSKVDSLQIAVFHMVVRREEKNGHGTGMNFRPSDRNEFPLEHATFQKMQFSKRSTQRGSPSCALLGARHAGARSEEGKLKTEEMNGAGPPVAVPLLGGCNTSMKAENASAPHHV